MMGLAAVLVLPTRITIRNMRIVQEVIPLIKLLLQMYTGYPLVKRKVFGIVFKLGTAMKIRYCIYMMIPLFKYQILLRIMADISNNLQFIQDFLVIAAIDTFSQPEVYCILLPRTSSS